MGRIEGEAAKGGRERRKEAPCIGADGLGRGAKGGAVVGAFAARLARLVRLADGLEPPVAPGLSEAALLRSKARPRAVVAARGARPSPEAAAVRIRTGVRDVPLGALARHLRPLLGRRRVGAAGRKGRGVARPLRLAATAEARVEPMDVPAPVRVVVGQMGPERRQEAGPPPRILRLLARRTRAPLIAGRRPVPPTEDLKGAVPVYRARRRASRPV